MNLPCKQCGAEVTSLAQDLCATCAPYLHGAARGPKAPDPTYLGDGVYASFDGYHIWLRTMRENGLHEIALEPPVVSALVAFADRIWLPGTVIRTALDERTDDGQG